jgi:predicted kinase
MNSPEKIVYLLRGLPATGKSYMAKKLAGENGVICETDEYFYTQVGSDTNQFDYKESLMPAARIWNYKRFEQSLASGDTPVIVDRDNALSLETQKYTRCAMQYGYRVEICEPESEWWQEIRVLLKYKDLTGPVLDQWAEELALYSRAIHRVPVSTIRHRMKNWVHDLTVEDILNYNPPSKT